MLFINHFPIPEEGLGANKGDGFKLILNGFNPEWILLGATLGGKSDGDGGGDLARQRGRMWR